MSTAEPRESTPVRSDGDLLREYLSGRGESSFAALVTRFGPTVYGVALRSLADHHAAEDVFQATFLVLARDGHKIRRPESVGAWLHGTSVRISRRALKQRLRESPVETLDPVDTRSTALHEIQQRHEQRLFDAELAKLPESYRAALVLHFIEGKTCDETAEALGTTVGSVRGRLQRGTRDLKRRLRRRGVTLASVVAVLSLTRSAADAAVTPSLVDATCVGAASGAGMGGSATASQLARPETTMLIAPKTLLSSAACVAVVVCAGLADAAAAKSVEQKMPADVRFQTEASADSASVLKTRPAIPRTAPVTVAPVVDEMALAQAAGSAPAADEAKGPPSRPALALKYGDGKPDGKKSIAGTGEMIRFTLPDPTQKLRSLRVHCARYGTRQAPDEAAEFTVVSDDGTDVVHTEMVPYNTFRRGESRWTTVTFDEPVVVPDSFWVILEFNAARTKGVYVSYDSSTGGKHSKTGVPGGASKEVSFGGDWMVQAVLTKPE